MSAQFQYGPAHTTTSDETAASAKGFGEPRAASGESVERFACAVRFGRRKSDPFGHLVLTDAALQFRGGRDLEVTWREVSAIAHVDHAVIVSLHNTRRTLHFCCQNVDDAARGSLVARQLLVEARPQRTIAFA